MAGGRALVFDLTLNYQRIYGFKLALFRCFFESPPLRPLKPARCSFVGWVGANAIAPLEVCPIPQPVPQLASIAGVQRLVLGLIPNYQRAWRFQGGFVSSNPLRSGPDVVPAIVWFRGSGGRCGRKDSILSCAIPRPMCRDLRIPGGLKAGCADSSDFKGPGTRHHCWHRPWKAGLRSLILTG